MVTPWKNQVLAYCNELAEQKRPAGQVIRSSARRFLEDVRSDAFYWDWRRHADACDFINALELTDVGKPFHVQPFQAWILALIYARRQPEPPHNPGTRILFIEAARGAGKSTFAAALMIHELISNDKQITLDLGSLTHQISGISKRIASSFAEQLGEPLKVNYAKDLDAIINQETKSAIRTLTAKEDRWNGASPLLCYIDEAAHIPSDIMSMALTGMAKREDSVLVTFSTPDSDRTRPYYNLRDVAVRDTINGEPEADTYALCWNIDDDDPVTADEEIVAKANPGLNVSGPHLDAIRRNFETMYENGSAEKRSAFVREHLCRFDDNVSTFLDLDAFDACQGKPELNHGDRVYVGIDLSRGGEGIRTDVCSITALRMHTGKAHIRSRHFLPDHDLSKHEKLTKMPLRDWAESGRLHLCPGKYIDGEQITAEVKRLVDDFEVVYIGVDKWCFNADLRSIWTDTFRWPVDYRGQPQHLTQACGWIMDAVNAGKLIHDGDPMLRKSLQNVVLRQSPSGAMRPCKNSTQSMIDPLISLLFAASLAADDAGSRPSMYAGDQIAI